MTYRSISKLFACGKKMLMNSTAIASSPPLAAKVMRRCHRVDNTIPLPPDPSVPVIFPSAYASPSSLLLGRLSSICIRIHMVLILFISYQVKFIHISCFITGPADSSFEIVIIWNM